MLSEESRYKLLKALEANPGASQRELAKELGISLGKVNYCLKAVVEKGWVKASNFTKSSNKVGYVYLLTPMGIEEKANVTATFLKRKIKEYEELKKEIASLTEEVLSEKETD
ncbi:MarR family EPS-associated transcriptional regulator [Saccharospirillum sp. HFRX-1]|uniref:MarR family EPS-associated transcriptional regulator n=1 Tax=unclassified Saccharospirillum TaxID=2633430 RepID=UPI00371C2731